jgi:hypothetical protein
MNLWNVWSSVTKSKKFRYIALVARDGWRKLNDNQWTLLPSEPLSQQRWQEIPLIANW